MTRKNYLSLLIAGAMGISCLGMNVSAESAFAVGDVDMDGTVTGHDTAMVSRYLLEEDYTLTEEQLSLADVDADGEVTQADADKLYDEMQEYKLGDTDWNVEGVNISDSSKVLQYYIHISHGLAYDDMNEVQRNLADMDLDGDVDGVDADLILHIYTVESINIGDENAENGIYYYSAFSDSPAYVGKLVFKVGDVDMDGIYTGHDWAMISRSNLEDDYELTEEQHEIAYGSGMMVTAAPENFVLGDVEWESGNNNVNIDDAVEVLKYYAYAGAGMTYDELDEVKLNLADMNLDGEVDVTDATLILTLYARAGAGLPDTNAENGIGYYSLDPESPAYIG